MDNEQRVCPKCGKELPNNYKYKCCEACRGKQASTTKKVGKAVIGGLATVGSVALLIISKGRIGKIK